MVRPVVSPQQLLSAMPSSTSNRIVGTQKLLMMMFLRHAIGFNGHSVSNAGCISKMAGQTSSCLTDDKDLPIPRAAVSVCVRCRDHYLLVQRGKAPNAGMWSFPGGKLEYAETTLDGARRELDEETKGWPPHAVLQWHQRPFDTTDTFGEGYHFVIAHCYAEVLLGANDPLPKIAPSDDAADAIWFRRDNIQALEESNAATTGLCHVIDRAKALLDANLLQMNQPE